MVLKVFYYTGPFMLILLIVLLGSANCFYVIFRLATCYFITVHGVVEEM